MIFRIKEKAFSVKFSIRQYTEIRAGTYIKVDKNILWVTPSIFEQLLINSNTDWTIIKN